MNKMEWEMYKAKRDAVVYRMFYEGRTDEEIAKALGITKHSAQTKRQGMGLRRPKHLIMKVDQVWLEQQFEEQIRPYYKAGDVDTVRVKIKQIAADADVSHEQIRRRLIAAELIDPDFSRMAHPRETWDLAEKLLKDDGLPYAEVARQTGISTRSLSEKLPGLGVRPEDYGEFRAARHLARKLGL